MHCLFLCLSFLTLPQVPFADTLDAPLDMATIPQWSKVVTAEPAIVLPGQSVTFRWPAGATRVVASGGGFGDGRRLSGETSVTDTVQHTTYYHFQVWYPDNRSENGLIGLHHPVGHQEVTVKVSVYPGHYPTLTTYEDRYHWHIDYPAGWKRFPVELDDPANNALIYFEPEEDSLERLAVAVVPVGHTRSADLMRKAISDGVSDYDNVTEVHQRETTQCGVGATLMTFRGIQRIHPDKPVRSIVVAFISHNRGYVISARMREDEYEQRVTLMQSLVRSFSLVPQSHRVRYSRRWHRQH